MTENNTSSILPVLAIVGRPNVGKSTLFNVLTRTRDALVVDRTGVTRDRHYGQAKFDEKRFVVVDTGGIGDEETDMDELMSEQSWQAIDEADSVLFVVDARAGLMPSDEIIAKKLRKLKKPVFLAVNKVDGLDEHVVSAEFHRLGWSDIYFIAASHGRGMTTLLTSVTQDFSDFSDNSSEHRGTKIAIVGRPNVGKSTLVNRMLGEDRVIVYDQPGTTRDSIYIPFERNEEKYPLIGTAGVRKRGKIHEEVEKFSVVKTLQAIKDANVVIFVMDAREGVVDHDLNLLGFALEAGRALVIAINKWDGMTPSERDFVKIELQRRLFFVEFADIHFISALHGTGVGNLYASVQNSFKSAVTRWPTNRLTTILEDAVSEHAPPMVNNRRIKLRYAHLGGANPPIIVIHGNQIEKVPKSYVRYLENTYRRVLKLVGTPIRIEFKGGENPYEGNKNTLTDRQVNKKRRLMSHHKKAEKKRKDKR